ncbi:MAG: CBS domain-containing protein, partial [Roseovarius sp.]|nr:CBS domain-containing protein [Roseovarius sp.]
LDLGDRTVEEIMLHRSQIEMIDASAYPKAILEKCLESSFSRLPVFDKDPENVIGVVHAKDISRELYKLLASNDDESGELDQIEIGQLSKKPYFVPETTTLDEQMRQFLRRRTHFALVVDEYGVLKGLITLEDILEEIVGDITDEFDKQEKPALEIIDSEQVIADGSMTIRDLNRARDWALPDEEANTIAGLVIHEAQIIPEPNQVFNYHGFRFEVLEKKQNRITRLKVRKL